MILNCHETSTRLSSSAWRVTHGGGSWRSGSAHGLAVGQCCQAIFFICAHCDRGHRSLQRTMPPEARRQQATVRHIERHQQSPKDSSIIAIVSESYRGRPPWVRPIARDDQGFPFDHFPGIIGLVEWADALHPLRRPQSWQSQPASVVRWPICRPAPASSSTLSRIPQKM